MNYLRLFVIRTHIKQAIFVIFCAQFSCTTQAAESGYQLDDIMVTARRYEDKQQTTPISMSVWLADDIAARGISDISDLDQFTPNLSFDTTAPISGSSNAASVFIRGVGQTDFLFTTDPGVGIYLDGVYIARSIGGVLNLIDIERVEVLRGPQGTVFGKNTIGGAINIITKKPDAILAGEGELTFGTFNRKDFRGSINVPIVDKFNSRFSLVSKNEDGYAKRLLTGQEMGGENEVSGRAAFNWLPKENFEINLNLDASYADEDSPPETIVSNNPAEIGALSTVFAGGAYNSLIGGGPSSIPAVPFNLLPGLPANTTPYDSRWLTNDLFTNNGTGPTGSEFTIFGASLTWNWDLDNFSVKSISAFRYLDTRFGRDPDGSPLTIVHTENEMQHEQWSQEVQLYGQSFNDRLNWLTGFYYLNEDGTDRLTVPFVDETFQIYQQLGIACALGNPCPNIFGLFMPEALIKNESIAAYFEGTYDLTKKLSFTAGLRWTQDTRALDATIYPLGFIGVASTEFVPNAASETFSNLSPRVSVEYQWTNDLMTYLSYSEGFKSGGFNQRYGQAIPDGFPTSFEPEEAQTIETGFKIELFDHRLRINAAAFFSEYENIQVVVFDSGIPRTINAAAGEIKGFELETTFIPTVNWLLQASYGYIDAEYTELDTQVVGSFGTPITNPLSLDMAFVNTPEHSLSLGIEYFQQLRDLGALTWRMDISYRSEWANDTVNTPELIQSGVPLFNPRLTFTPENDNWEITAFVNNLTDEEYIFSGLADKQNFGIGVAIVAPPREAGLVIRYKF